MLSTPASTPPGTDPLDERRRALASRGRSILAEAGFPYDEVDDDGGDAAVRLRRRPRELLLVCPDDEDEGELKVVRFRQRFRDLLLDDLASSESLLLNRVTGGAHLSPTLARRVGKFWTAWSTLVGAYDGVIASSPLAAAGARDCAFHDVALIAPPDGDARFAVRPTGLLFWLSGAVIGLAEGTADAVRLLIESSRAQDRASTLLALRSWLLAALAGDAPDDRDVPADGRLGPQVLAAGGWLGLYAPLA